MKILFVIVSLLMASCLMKQTDFYSIKSIEQNCVKLGIPNNSSFLLKEENFDKGIKSLKNEGVKGISFQNLGTLVVNSKLDIFDSSTETCSISKFKNINSLIELSYVEDQNKINEFKCLLRIHPDLKNKIEVNGKESIIVFWSMKYDFKVNQEHIEFGKELNKKYPKTQLFFVNSDFNL